MKKIVPLLVFGLVLGGYYFGRYLYFKPKYHSGESARDFTAQLIDGSQFGLSDLRGKYVLIHFWGSWCGPCRLENPDLVALYRQYSSTHFEEAEGFEIVSIAIETNEKSWKSAIARDGLDWKYHIGQFDRFSSPIARLYGVRSIPTKYLLDTDGTVIRVNPSLEEIAALLAEKSIAER